MEHEDHEELKEGNKTGDTYQVRNQSQGHPRVKLERMKKVNTRYLLR